MTAKVEFIFTPRIQGKSWHLIDKKVPGLLKSGKKLSRCKPVVKYRLHARKRFIWKANANDQYQYWSLHFIKYKCAGRFPKYPSWWIEFRPYANKDRRAKNPGQNIYDVSKTLKHTWLVFFSPIVFKMLQEGGLLMADFWFFWSMTSWKLLGEERRREAHALLQRIAIR